MRVHPLVCTLLLSVASSAHAQEPPAGTAPPPPPSNLEAGGLRPPEAVESEQPTQGPAAEAQVETELEKADSEDTGRGLEFVWLNGEVGYQMVSLQALSDGDLVDGSAVDDSQSGLMFGGGLGVRLFVVTLGARFRYSNFEAWDMWSINAEAAFHIPIGKLDLYFGLGAGYVALTGVESDAPGAAAALSEFAVKGMDVRAGLGVDYYLSNTFSIGANVGGEILVLRRSSLSIPSDDTSEELADYASDGSSVGAAFTPTAVIGLHF